MNIADVGSILSPATTLSQVSPSIFSIKQVLGPMVPKTGLQFSLYALGLAIPIIPNWSGIYSTIHCLNVLNVIPTLKSLPCEDKFLAGLQQTEVI